MTTMKTKINITSFGRDNLELPKDFDDLPVPVELYEPVKTFRKELEDLINRHCKENGSDTPDFILAEYLEGCLELFDKTTRARNMWYRK